jgi:hypothetical protein
MESKSILNFMHPELFNKVKEKVLSIGLGPNTDHFYHTVAGRWIAEIHFDYDTEQEILKLAKEVFGDDDLKRAGFHVARYQKQNGVKPQLWKHYDQSACQYSLDMCIEKNVDWQLVVDDVVYEEQPNSCVVFSGNDNMHWRTPYPTEDEDKYVTLLFMQFAKPDHWFFIDGGKEGFNRHGHKSDFKFREIAGYWAQPDYSDGRPICECCDYRNVLRFETRYQAGERWS